ncbi:hypothetical protein KCP73_08065 [Salmonella enterica subsp. enterica]|nr:hypothetical protein KCP73_08065 [Salmonella enterica subsp. enterica]
MAGQRQHYLSSSPPDTSPAISAAVSPAHASFTPASPLISAPEDRYCYRHFIASQHLLHQDGSTPAPLSPPDHEQVLAASPNPCPECCGSGGIIRLYLGTRPTAPSPQRSHPLLRKYADRSKICHDPGNRQLINALPSPSVTWEAPPHLCNKTRVVWSGSKTIAIWRIEPRLRNARAPAPSSAGNGK